MPSWFKVDPMIVKLVQPSAPHRGSIDQAITQRTNGLAFRCTGSKMSYAFPGPDVAPIATLVNYATWYDFNLTGGAVSVLAQYPWFQQKQHQTIRAWVTLAFAYDLQVKVRLAASTLVETLLTVYSAESQILVFNAGVPQEQPWRTTSTLYRLATCNLEVAVSSPATDRRCKLSFQAQYASMNNANPMPASSNRDLYIHSVAFEDLHKLVEPT